MRGKLVHNSGLHSTVRFVVCAQRKRKPKSRRNKFNRRDEETNTQGRKENENPVWFFSACFSLCRSVWTTPCTNTLSEAAKSNSLLLPHKATILICNVPMRSLRLQLSGVAGWSPAHHQQRRQMWPTSVLAFFSTEWKLYFSGKCDLTGILRITRQRVLTCFEEGSMSFRTGRLFSAS